MSLIDRVSARSSKKPVAVERPAPQKKPKPRAQPEPQHVEQEVDAWEAEFGDAPPASTAEAEFMAATEAAQKPKSEPGPKPEARGRSILDDVTNVATKRTRRRRVERENPTVGKDADADVRQSREFNLDIKRLSSGGFITPNVRRSRISEEFRLIKRRLMQRMSLGAKAATSKRRRDRQHVILVTSSRPGEGKSFTAINLALSILFDERLNVLLVDADTSRPSVSRSFGLRADLPGLTDLLLRSDIGLSDVLLREKKWPLSFMPAGGAVDSATDLFASEDMRRLTTDLASKYTDRVIIVDAPPLLASTEPVALAEHVGQVVMVIDAERTARSSIESALDLLETHENVNLVLNKTIVQSRNEQFGNYYDEYTQISN